MVLGKKDWTDEQEERMSKKHPPNPFRIIDRKAHGVTLPHWLAFVATLLLVAFWVVQTMGVGGQFPWLTWIGLAVGLLLAGAYLLNLYDRRQIESRLIHSDIEPQFHLLVESLPQNVYVKDVDGRFIFANQHYCATAGKPLEEILGKTDFEIHPAALAEKYRADDLRVIETGMSLELVEEHNGPNGERCFVQVIKAPFHDSQRNIAGTLGIFWDVTERKRSEELLRQQGEQLRTLYEASQRLSRTLDLQEIYQAISDFMSAIAPNDMLVISSFDHETKLIACRAYHLDDKWMDVSSFPPIPLEEEGKGTQSLVIRSGQSMLINDYQARMKFTQTNYYVDSETNEISEATTDEEGFPQSALIVPLKDGEKVNGVIQVMSYRLGAYTEDQLKLLEALALHIVSAEKNAMLYAQVQAELNERKLTEDALRRKEAEYRLIADNTGDLIWMLDLESQRFIYASPSAEKLLGYTPQEMLAQSLSTLLTPASLAYALQEVSHQIKSFNKSRSKVTNTDELELVRKDGSIVQVEVSTTFVANESGRLQIVGISRDITGRKEAEFARYQSELKFRALFELSPDAVMLIDPHDPNISWPIIDCNEEACLMNGYSRDELIGASVDIINTYPAERAERTAYLNQLREKGNLQLEAFHRHKNGTVFPIEVSTTLIKVGDRELVIGIDRDITARKAAEKIQSQQRETLEYHFDLVEILTSISTRFINLPIDQINAEIYRALKQLGEFEKVDRGYVFLFESDHVTMNNTHEWCAPGVEPQIDNLQGLSVDSFSWWMAKMNRGEEVYIPLVSELSPESQALREILEPQGIQSLLEVPLISNNTLIGFAGFDAVLQPHTWDEDSILLLKMMGDIISNALTRKTNEEAVKLIEKRNQALLENMPSGIVLMDAGGNFTFASPFAYRMFGYTSQEVVGTKALLWVHPEDAPLLNSKFLKLLDNPTQAFTSEYRFKHKDGFYLWVEATFNNLLHEPGVNAIVNNFHDITERKRAEIQRETSYLIAQAAQNAESLQELYPRIHEHIGRVMQATNFYIALYHESAGTMEFVYWVDEVDPMPVGPQSVGDGYTSYILRMGKSLLLKHGLSNPPEVNLKGSPSRIWLGVPLMAHGKTIGAMAVQHYSNPNAYTEDDQRMLEFVSTQVATAIERKQNEEAVRRIELRNRALIENAPDGIIMLDLNGRFIFASPSAARLFGYEPKDLLGKPSTELMHPEDRRIAGEIRQEFIDAPSAVINHTYRVLHKSGSYRWIEATYTNLLNQPELDALVVNFRDITESRKMELEIQERVKELTCLFDVSRLLSHRQETLETVCNKIVASIAPAMKFPHLAIPLLTLDDRRYTIDGFHEDLAHSLCASIEVNGSARGQVCVFYSQAEPFILPEEQDMLGNVARMLGLWIEQREAETAVHAAQQELEELNRNLEKRVEERTDEVRQREATYRALFENSNDGIFLMSPDGEDVAANEQALKMLGYTLEEYLRLPSNSIAAADQQADANERFAAVLRGYQVPLYERTFIGKSGKKVEVEINLSPVRDATGRIILVQSVVRDITERKKAQEALRESRDKLSAANSALEKASRMKDEFLASMSHELRTPLTGILGLSEVLQLEVFGALNEKQARALNNIETSGRHLLELINDILDLSKIEAGKLDLQFEPCSVSDICQASLQLMKGMAHQKHQNIDFSMKPALINVRADARRLKQMLVNLLGNAVKFTPEGGQLGLDVIADRGQKLVFFTVWDKGIGIEAEAMGKLFKPFTQLDSSLARQYSGTGLGLSLVQRMAELHGGSIDVKSKPGEGSRFTICLPWSLGETQPLRSQEKRDTGSLKSAMVVEDNEFDSEHMVRYLKGLGIAHITQTVIHGAIEKVLLLQPSVILLDLNMPDGSGLELLSSLKADERTRDVPVIVVSVEERRAEAMNLGAVGYLLKPYTQQELRAELDKAISFLPPALSQGLTRVEVGATTPLVMLADDNELVLGMVSDFLEAKGYRVIATRSGVELLDCVAESRPDIMLVDIQMPVLDGMETIRRLRAHADPAIAATPIIAITALAMSGDREKCLEAGANEYLSKPIVLRQLVDLIGELLKGRENRPT